MILTAQVLSCLHNYDRYEAVLVINGSPTTFSCSHSHQTPLAAAKCLEATVGRAERILDDPLFRQIEINSEGLVEWRVTASLLGSDDPTRFDSIRLWLHRHF